MPWESLENVPGNIRTHDKVPLTLAQANRWAELFDAITKAGGAETPAAVAWTQWEKEYKKSEDGKSWVKIKPKEVAESYDCECLGCGHKMTSEDHCADFKCPECGGEMRRVERPGVGYQDFVPPEAGDAPDEVKDILKKVYSSCRLDWTQEHPADKENTANKESCSRIAWSAVEKAGWTKDAEGKWTKKEVTLSLSSIKSINTTTVLQGSTIQSIFDRHPPEEGARAWLALRKRMWEDSNAWMVDQLLFVDDPTEDILADILWEGEWMLYEVNPTIVDELGDAVVVDLPEGGFPIEIKTQKIAFQFTDSLSSVAPHETPKAEIDTDWDATAAELRIRKWASSDGSGDKDKIDWAKYRQGFTWYDSDDIENIGSYKLPHHDIIDDSLKVVWKGVFGAMAALLGARGGVDIPSGDKKPVYTHLSNHYEQFEKEPPELSRCDDFFSAVTPKFQQLSEDEAERTGQTELLMIDGTAIAEGFWKGTDFPVDVVKDALERAGGLRIDVEHEDETWEDVKGFNYKPRWNDAINGIDVSGAIFDEKVIEWYKRNPDTKIGLSVKLNENAKFEQINGKKTCTFLDFKGITLTLNPACKVCWLKSAELVELSSSDDESDGGIEMAETKKTPEELAAEKKLADEKLAEEKKLKEAKKLEDEKNKLADDKAKEDKLNKEKEDAATAKPAAADSTLDPELEKRFSDMQTEINSLKQANQTLSNERSLSDTKIIVNGLIESGHLSEAKREGTTKVLMALSSDEDRAAFLNTLDGVREWEAGEKGLALSEEKKPEDKDLEFSEAERGVFT